MKAASGLNSCRLIMQSKERQRLQGQEGHVLALRAVKRQSDFERAEKIRGLLRWWDTWVQGDCWRVGKRLLTCLWRRKREMKKEKENLHCASGPRFKHAARFWVGLQLSGEDFQLNFKSWKEKEVLQSQKEWDSYSSPVQVHLIMQIVTKQPWKSSARTEVSIYHTEFCQ